MCGTYKKRTMRFFQHCSRRRCLDVVQCYIYCLQVSHILWHVHSIYTPITFLNFLNGLECVLMFIGFAYSYYSYYNYIFFLGKNNVEIGCRDQKQQPLNFPITIANDKAKRHRGCLQLQQTMLHSI